MITNSQTCICPFTAMYHYVYAIVRPVNMAIPQIPNFTQPHLSVWCMAHILSPLLPGLQSLSAKHIQNAQVRGQKHPILHYKLFHSSPYLSFPHKSSRPRVLLIFLHPTVNLSAATGSRVLLMAAVHAGKHSGVAGHLVKNWWAELENQFLRQGSIIVFTLD